MGDPHLVCRLDELQVEEIGLEIRGRHLDRTDAGAIGVDADVKVAEFERIGLIGREDERDQRVAFDGAFTSAQK